MTAAPRKPARPCRAPLLFAAILLTGCGAATRPVPVEDRATAARAPDAETARADTAVDVPPGAGEPAPDAAVTALLAESDQRLGAGNPESAADALERALHLRPKDPWVWHRLSRVRLAQSRWFQAISLAEKSISLARGDRALLAANWQVIADARAAMGDESGAEQARRRARDYSAETRT